MAKDGTARGGARVGAGRKPKALADKIAQGASADVLDLPKPADMEGVTVPPVKDFLKAAQKSGVDLCAEEVFKSTYHRSRQSELCVADESMALGERCRCGNPREKGGGCAAR